MSAYSVQITSRSLGIKFTGFGKHEFDIYQVVINSIGDKLGISVGDTLLTINDIPVSEITNSPQYAFKDIQYVFYDQRLPFTATFKKTNKPEDIEVDNDEISEYIHTESDSLSYDQSTPLGYSPVQQTFKVNNKHSLNRDSCYSDSDLTGQSDTDLFEKHIIQASTSDSDKKKICFDKVGICDQKICFVSSNGLSEGYYEWIIEIVKCDVDIQEIGVIGTTDMNDIKNNKFGAYSIFGNELSTNSMYYGSYNNDGSKRCFRDLSKKYDIGWTTGDIIRIKLNLNKSKIKFYLNGVNVRKAMSLQQGQTYYPIIMCAGNCQYQLAN
eukprot:436121_1